VSKDTHADVLLGGTVAALSFVVDHFDWAAHHVMLYGGAALVLLRLALGIREWVRGRGPR